MYSALARDMHSESCCFETHPCEYIMDTINCDAPAVVTMELADETYVVDDRALRRPSDCVGDRLRLLLASHGFAASMNTRSVSQSRIPS